MNERELQIIKEHIEVTIEKTVNGKINQLQSDFDEHTEKIEKVFNEKNLATIEKILLGFSGGSLWIKFIMLMGGLIITIGGAIVTIKKIF